jgi:acetylornithine deacetylase/succinyl-diaminopimelate desuccinylase-like protein
MSIQSNRIARLVWQASAHYHARMSNERPAVDWNEISEHAVSLLSDYIRINTTNPPGGEEAGAIFLRDALAREGIDSEFHDAGDDRVSISARIPAATATGKKPLVLLSHIDVVPVEPEFWKIDPFSGDVVEDVIWGRGALDMKGMGVMELLTAVLLKRHGVELDRDVVFVAVADEEEGGHQGVHHLRRTRPELLEAEYVFNEGAYGFSEFMGQKVKMIGLGPSEKSPVWIKLRTKGAPGHGSVPHKNNALVRLVNALAKIEAREQRARLTAPVEAMIRTLQQRGLVPADLDPNDSETLEAVGSINAHLSALTHDTVSITGVHAGSKHNVIPVGAEATLDCRILPDTDAETFLAELRGVIDDPEVEIESVLQHDSGTSSLDTPVHQVVTDVVREKFGDEGMVVPMLSPGFTDSHAYRAAGAHAYGFTPSMLTSEELGTIHGHNERISVANLALGTEMLFEVTRRLAGARVA